MNSEQCSVSTVDVIDTGRLTQVIESIEFIHLQTSRPEHSYYCVREREREQSELT